MIFYRRLVRLLKALLVISSVFLVFKLVLYGDDSGVPRIDTDIIPFNGSFGAFDQLYSQRPVILSDLSSEPNFSSPLDPKTIIESTEFLNAHHKILNVESFGAPSAESVSVVVVVQVHNRPEYLSYLIETLRNARGINQTLVVFSHDMSSPEINALIQNITFCRVIQIFYPHNIQLFPNVFPGQDPSDCPEKISKPAAERMKCNNAQHPDTYGNYRVAKLTQIKHHWWWKMNYVFDGVVKRYGLDGKYVLMLEEDHYIAPDSLHVLDLMIMDKHKVCPECEVLCLGIYLKKYTAFAKDINKLSAQVWFSSKHNMGFAVNIQTWDKIRNCSKLFCKFDDYNWDWSLLHVSIKCMNPRMRVIVAKAPRVIHIGDCGVHTHRCQAHDSAKRARELFETNAHLLFPSSLERNEITKRTLKPSKANGGWGDVRDYDLCLNNTYPYHQAAYRSSSALAETRGL